MVTITPEAAQVLAQTAEANQIGEGEVLRLVPADQGLGLQPGTPQESDHVLMHNETAVLAVPAEVEESLGNAVIELKETDQGAQLTISSMG